MSDRYDSYPPDEPVIGDSYPEGVGYSAGSPPVISAVDDTGEIDMIGGYDVIGADDPATLVDDLIGSDDPGTVVDDATYDDEYDYEDGEYYEDYADEVNPARQPIFYVFLGIAVLVGVIFVFLLYSLFAGGGDDGGELPSASFSIVVDQPVPNERVEAGVDLTIAIRANASEPIVTFELFVQDRAVDSVDAQQPVGDAPYSASFKWRFNSKGEYTIFVRATSESGATKDSDKVKVVAFEGPGDRPVSIAGRVVASVSMRTGPGDNFEAVGTLTAGQQVQIIGKSRDADWLLIETDGGRWVKRQAIEVLESLALVPIREPTPVPQPTATNTPDPSPSPTATPTVNPADPDLSPRDALLIGAKKLRITVQNTGGSFAGALTITVDVKEEGSDVTTSKQVVFDVQIPSQEGLAIDFDLSETITAKSAVRVTLESSIPEQRTDNNTTTFVLTPEEPTAAPDPSPSPSPEAQETSD